MTLPVIVAIPARNEATQIGACLTALAAQPAAGRNIVAVVLYANNCTDETAAAAQSIALPFPLQIIEATLPPGQAHIGHARRGAAQAAAAWLEDLGLNAAVIAGTDADSRVAPDWLSSLQSAFRPEIDAVCGVIVPEVERNAALQSALAAEAAYASAVARVYHTLDPRPHDPWPNHIWCWGANFSVRASALSDAGGVPVVNLAEDRALHAKLLRLDARIRHATDVRVITSSRFDGRAPGGLADLLRHYEADPAAEADYYLEPADLTLARARLRGQERLRWREAVGFGAYWADLEAACPLLRPKRVRLSEMASETAKLENWLTSEGGQSESQAGEDTGGLRYPVPPQQ